MNNVIKSKLANSDLPLSVIDQIRGAEFKVPPGLNEEQTNALVDAEMAGIKGVFYFLLGTAALTLLLSFAVEDKGLPGDEKKEEKPVAEKAGDEKNAGLQGNQEREGEGPPIELARTISLT